MPDLSFEEYRRTAEQRLARLTFLDEIGRKLESMPALTELLAWLAGRVTLAMPDPERCVAAIEFDGEVHGSANALRATCRIAEPIRRGDQLAGQICVAYEQPRALGQEEHQLLAAAAQRVSAYAQVRGLIDEAQARAHQLEVLYELGRALSAHLRMEQVLDEIYRGVSQLVDASNFYIGLYDRQRNEVTFPLNVTESVVDRHISAIPADAGLTGYVLRTAQGLLIESEVAGWLGEHGIEVVGELAACWLGVPLLIGDEVQGIMAVQDYATANAFTESHRAMLAAIASQASVAIQNAQLFQELESRARHEQALREITFRVRGSTDLETIARTAVQELGTVLGRRAFVWLGGPLGPSLPDADQAAEASRESTAALELDAMLERIVTLVKERFGYYHAQIFRYEPALGAVVLVCGYGEIGQRMLAAGHSLRLRCGVVGTAAASGEPVLAPNVSAEPGWISNPYLPDTKGELAVPIRLGDRVVGVIDVQSDVAGALGEEDRTLLELVSEPVALAIESAALRQEMEDSLRMLGTAAQRPGAEGGMAAGQADKPPRGYLYDRIGVRSIDERWASLLGRTLQNRASGAEENPDHGPVMSLLIAQGETLGVLGIYADPGHPLSEQELQLVQMVCEQVAAALGNARLAETTRAALLEARTLYRFGELVSRETDESALCASVSLALVEDLGYAGSVVWVLDTESDALVEVAQAGEPGSHARHMVSLSDPRDVVVRAVQSRGTSVAMGTPGTPLKGIYDSLALAGLEPGVPSGKRQPDGWETDAGPEPGVPGGMGWVAAVPILAESGPLGAIQVSCPADVPELGDRDVRILEAVAIQAANAIQRARLLNQTQEALAAADAATRRYLHDAWDSFLEGRAEETGTYVAGPEGVRREGGLRLPEMQSALDRQEVVPVVAPAEQGRSARSSLAVPLRVRGEVIGVVDLYREGIEQGWNERERELVVALVEEIGETLEGERQFAQTRATLAETERMYQASQRISAADGPSDILDTVRDIIASTGIDQVAVFTFRGSVTDGLPAEQELSTFWARDNGEPMIPVGSIRSIDELPIPYSMSRRKALVVPDVSDGSHLDPGLREPLLAGGFRAFAAIPLAVGEEWLGYSLALAKSPHRFTPGELRVHESVGRQAAIALRSARLYQEAQSRARREQLIREITSRMRATVDLETILNTAVEELGRALGVSRAFVRLSTGPADTAPGRMGDAATGVTAVDNDPAAEGQK